MKNIIYSIFILMAFFSEIKAQNHQNVELVATDTTEFSANDIWGYVDGNGIEYAVIGTKGGTEIYSLEVPEQPLKIASIYGNNTVWRDIKSFGDYVYIIADNAPDGLVIVNMSQAPDTVTHEVFLPVFQIVRDSTIIDTLGSEIFTRDTTLVEPLVVDNCHNIYIDEDRGLLFTAGCDSWAGGAAIYDIGDNPEQPVFLGATRVDYAHDVYAKGDLMVTSEIYAGQLGFYDISIPTEPILLATQQTSSTFTHNAWLSDDSQYVFSTDERAFGNVDAYDISDLNNIERTAIFSPYETRDAGIVPHNTHYLNGFLFTSWYTSGVVITDAHRPHNLIQVGQYDTYSGPDGGGQGCWGAYPFLPSGLLLASDRSTGLYVLQPDVKRACYFEGMVKAMGTGLPINGAVVEIIGFPETLRFTEAAGNFATGVVDSGSYQISVSHPDYKTETFFMNLNNGELINATVCMTLDTPSSVADQTFISNNIKVYPSPFVNDVTIELKEDFASKVRSVEVRDMSGRTVYTSTEKWNNTQVINLQNLQSGKFFVQFMTEENEIFTVPVLKVE